MNADIVPRATRRDWIGLAVLILPTLLIAIDMTILNLAVPALTRDLAPSSSQLLWIMDIYGFLIAGSLITMGTLGDRIGRRRLLMIGAAAFGLASMLAAFSQSAEMLIAARALLGIAGATLMPSTMSLLSNMFRDPAQFRVAIGVWVSGFSAGTAIGPLVGGALLERFWWGSVFLVAVPVMILLVILGPLVLPEFRNPEAGRLDLVSAALSLAAVLTTIFGLKQFAENGIGWVPLLSVVIGVMVGIVFVRRQVTLTDPLLDLALFRHRAYGISVLTMTLGVFAAVGANFFVAQYLQLVLGLSPLQAGLWTLPGVVAFIVGANLAPRLVRWWRPVFVISTGWLMAAVGFVLLTQTGVVSGLAVLVTANVIMSLGFGWVITLVTEMILGSAPPERAGSASALSETSQEFGGALGIAVLGSIGTAVYRTAIAGNLPAEVPAAAADAARDTLGGAVEAATLLADPLGATLLAVARTAFVQGLHLTATIAAVVMAAMAVLTIALLRGVRTESPASAKPHVEASYDEAEVARAA
jgi:MFS transporter, DHA2 family, multidrug resistance protein